MLTYVISNEFEHSPMQFSDFLQVAIDASETIRNIHIFFSGFFKLKDYSSRSNSELNALPQSSYVSLCFS